MLSSNENGLSPAMEAFGYGHFSLFSSWFTVKEKKERWGKHAFWYFGEVKEHE